ncbi:exosortase Y-associated Wzy-like protein, partial [Rubrivirga sp.]|uniref:exosortase Y-associated Wzy-like protein n=1 Tax=Rubrivirga sp. TaxID=1885344 RepID=UPI003C71081E
MSVSTHDADDAGSAWSVSTLSGYALLFIPFGIAAALSALPLVSYLVAWAGSFWILWLTMTGRVRPLPDGASALDQLLRPIVLTQILFAFYNFLASVFFVADLYGFYYLSKESLMPVHFEDVALAAQAQRYYVLAHAGVAVGMLAAMDYRRSGEWVVRPFGNPALVILVLSGITYLAADALSVQNQFGARFDQFSLVSSILGLTLALSTRRVGLVGVGFVLFSLNLSEAFLSGFKEEVLVMVLLLGVFLYPHARRAVLIGGPLLLVFLLAVLPAYTNVIRGLSWRGGVEAEAAASQALEEIRSGGVDLGQANWAFLTDRISQIGMFTRYISRVEQTDEFYGTQILEQAAIGLVPRALWAGKPNMEELAMARVYDLGIIETYSKDVSAKSQYVVDGFLSAGGLGVLLASVLLGLLMSWSSRASERWFGGYFWGSGLVFTSMFAIFWKGSTFEFFFSNVLWSFILLIPLFLIGRATGVLIHRDEVEANEVAPVENRRSS